MAEKGAPQNAPSLWSSIERTETGPQRYSEAQFSYTDRSAREQAQRVRATFDEWYSRYPEAERAAFASAFRSDIDTQHVAAATELYYHEMLRRMGYAVEVHPQSPSGSSKRTDFRAQHPEVSSPLFLEAVLATDQSDEERAADARKFALYDALNGLGPTDFYLSIHGIGSPGTSPPAAKLRNQVRAWLASMNADTVSQQIAAGAPWPALPFEHGGWRLTIDAYPKPAAARGREGTRPIAAMNRGLEMLETWAAIRDAVEKKAQRYGDLGDPYVVGVNVGQYHVDEIDILAGLFGREVFYPDEPGRRKGVVHERNGVWTGPGGPRNRGVSGVLISNKVEPWAVAQRETRLYHNPWATHPCVGPITQLPQSVPRTAAGLVLPPPDGSDLWMVPVDGVAIREILGLPPEWP